MDSGNSFPIIEASADRVYLTINFDQKDKAKQLGAKWDVQKRKWWVSSYNKEAIRQFTNVKIKKYYLQVPFDKKEEVKQHGANWDIKKKQWYVTDINSQLRKLYPMPADIKLVGENRNFIGDEHYLHNKFLFVDYIPKTCWFTNVRYCVTNDDWDLLRKHVYRRTKFHCETCGIHTKKLEAHERWSYHISYQQLSEQCNVQKLERLVALCRPCHLSTHYGFASHTGEQKLAYDNILTVNNWTAEQFDEHLKIAQQLYIQRSDVNWELDLSLITNSGLTIVKPVTCDSRQEISRIMIEDRDPCYSSDNDEE